VAIEPAGPLGGVRFLPPDHGRFGYTDPLVDILDWHAIGSQQHDQHRPNLRSAAAAWDDAFAGPFSARTDPVTGRMLSTLTCGLIQAVLRGCTELRGEIDIDFDVIFCACGTGGTLAGIAAGLSSGQRAIGFAALRGGQFLADAGLGLCRQDAVRVFTRRSGTRA
jgi:hypothetical protein